MALETERCSPSSAASPGPTTNRRPGSEAASGYPQSGPGDEATADAKTKPKSAFHQIALLTRCSSPPSSVNDPDPCETTSNPVFICQKGDESTPNHPFDRPSFRIRRVPDVKIPSRPHSNESCSNHSVKQSPTDKQPYSDSSSACSPSPISPERRNGFASDTRSHLYHPNMASLSLVYGLGVIPNRFPLSLHLPTVYPEVPATMPVLQTPIKPPESISMFVGRSMPVPLPDHQGFVDSRLLGSIKPQKSAKDLLGYPVVDFRPGSSCGSTQGRQCDCCRSPSPRSPSPQHPAGPGPSALTFSVDNILRPDFGRLTRSLKSPPLSCSQQIRRKTSKSALKTAAISGEDCGKQTDKLQQAGDQLSSGAASSAEDKDNNGQVWPAWVYCTRYSDRPSSEIATQATDSSQAGAQGRPFPYIRFGRGPAPFRHVTGKPFHKPLNHSRVIYP
ncbi:sequence-specific DNA binding [Homalodisca vitripennis]|nr:sequence-specific DNA binding [Homalodisca vitripennis]